MRTIRRRIRSLIPLFVFACLTRFLHAQYEIPDEMFRRTLLIRHANSQATAFKFDQGGRIYLVTTRHFAKTLPPKNATIQVWRGRSWEDFRAARIMFPTLRNVDLAILETDEKISQPYSVIKSAEVLTTGQQVWLIGWMGVPPVPILPNLPRSSRPSLGEIPNDMKIGTISAIDPTQPDSLEIEFRGSYNARIAGGPIFYWSPVHKDYEILGVVKREERSRSAAFDAKPEKKGPRMDKAKGYSIDLVTEAIAANTVH